MRVRDRGVARGEEVAGHDFRKRKLPLATAPSCAVSRSKHFATQNGLLSKFCYAKPPTASAVFAVFDRPVFLRGAYFAVHKRLDLNFDKLFLRNSLKLYNKYGEPKLPVRL